MTTPRFNSGNRDDQDDYSYVMEDFPKFDHKEFQKHEVSPREKVEIKVLPMLEFLLLFGFAKVTKGKNNFSCNKEAKN